MGKDSDKKHSKSKNNYSSDLTKKIRIIMEQIKFQAKLQEKINPKKYSYHINLDES